ncbi:helix-turn-helix transcriptional regulator [Pseudomonas nitroreducens]|uniref:helix-turn-helix transcriptional regulator n=1 Tax=Pseudomonas nitroreducens TaxID=46680 RepID=UPI00038219B5|nr:helix-turn-helix transcriptional regulator [Pseudomonas nitroreducens]
MNRITEFRAKRRIQQKALAHDMGWTPSRLSSYETGRREPALDDCRAIVTALNARGVSCSLDDVFPPEAGQQNSAAA